MSDEGIEAKVAATRANLESTLDAIEDKFNVPKRVGELTDRAKESYDKNPIPWIIGAAAVAVGIASIIAWAVLSGDDD